MATVTGKTSAKIDELLNATVVSTAIDSAGQLSYTKKDGTTVNSGSVGQMLAQAVVSSAGKLIFTRRNGTTVDVGSIGKPLDAYPVNAIYMSVSGTNPGTIFGGTWAAFGQGRVLVGVDPTQPEFDSALEIGGSKTVTQTVAQMPTHKHTATTSAAGLHDHGTPSTPGPAPSSNGTTTSFTRGNPAATEVTNHNLVDSDGEHTHPITVGDAGGGEAMPNLQPYITVFMFRRTA